MVQSDNQPLVTIVLPVFNAEKTISEIIQSVICQSYSNWELIIVDDGSTDGSRAVIRSFTKNDTRIRYHQIYSAEMHAWERALNAAK